MNKEELEAIRNPIVGQLCNRCKEMVINKDHICQDLVWAMAF